MEWKKKDKWKMERLVQYLFGDYPQIDFGLL